MKMSLGLGTSVVFFLLLFQNCAVPSGSENEETEGTSLSSANTPFAFELSVNRIAYLSCSKISENEPVMPTSSFFTFRVGAIGDSQKPAGLRLSPSFLSHARQKKWGKINAAGEQPITRSELKEFIKSSAESFEAQIHLSVRPIDRPEGLLFSGEKEIDYIFPNLTSEIVLDNLVSVKGDERVSDILGNADIDRRELIGDLAFFRNPRSLRQSLDNKLENLIVLGYSESLRTPERARRVVREPGANRNERKKIYGLGLRPKFAPTSSDGQERRALQSVDEYDMTLDVPDRTAKGHWRCDPELRYRVHSFNDSDSHCEEKPDPLPGTGTDSEEYHRIALRSVLPPEDWFINISQRCIRPKKGSCYPVAHRPGKDPDHFLSICYKAN